MKLSRGLEFDMSVLDCVQTFYFFHFDYHVNLYGINTIFSSISPLREKYFLFINQFESVICINSLAYFGRGLF
jgi:hypothetical protein